MLLEIPIPIRNPYTNQIQQSDLFKTQITPKSNKLGKMQILEIKIGTKIKQIGENANPRNQNRGK
jgi:hypothetical protein